MGVVIIHVVKRLGRLGGMESYVWHLIHGLAEKGAIVAVVCEVVFEYPAENINLVQVESSPERPRWKSMLSFRNKVRLAIQQRFAGQLAIIHSHERSLGHQVTTFHGPPINFPASWNLLARLSPRLRAWRIMEYYEILSPTVQIVLPVSSIIKKALCARYELKTSKVIELAWPGVVSVPESWIKTSSLSNPVKFLFVGREWKRKGLQFAIAVVNEFRRTRSDAILTVFGADFSAYPKDILKLDWVVFEGWSATIPWQQFDILIHPAFQEPFGMVVAEARSHGLPVLMSTEVGAADLRFSNTQALSLTDPIYRWCSAAQRLLEMEKKVEVKWSWDALVDKHLTRIYPKVSPIKISTISNRELE